MFSPNVYNDNLTPTGSDAMIGQKISHYEVMEELGRGGMGAVYKARDILLDRELAIKILRPDIANATRERRFIQEAKTASSLNHPNIVTIYEIFHVGEAACIAMEYISGETLESTGERPAGTAKGAWLGDSDRGCPDESTRGRHRPSRY